MVDIYSFMLKSQVIALEKVMKIIYIFYIYKKRFFGFSRETMIRGKLILDMLKGRC